VTELGEFAMWIAIGAGQVAFWFALSPVIKAFAGRIAGRGAGGQRFEELEARLTSLEERGLTTGEAELQHTRLAELEERMDFTERMLSRPGTAPPPDARHSAAHQSPRG
jgi:hypothetical protein